MSYINDALKKAQQERDSRYGHFGGIIAPSPDRPGRPRGRRIVSGPAVALVLLVSAALLVVFFTVRQPLSGTKETPAPVVAGPPATLESTTQQVADTPAGAETAPETVPAGGMPAGVKAERASASVEAGQETVRKGEGPPAAAPGGPQALQEAEIRYKKALLAQGKGDLRAAEDLYLKVLALDPGHVRALNNLGVLSLAQNRRERAIAHLSKAIALKKDYVDPYYNLACLYARDNEIDESLRYLKLAAAINGDVKKWAEKDDDMKNVIASPAYKKIMEGQKN